MSLLEGLGELAAGRHLLRRRSAVEGVVNEEVGAARGALHRSGGPAYRHGPRALSRFSVFRAGSSMRRVCTWTVFLGGSLLAVMFGEEAADDELPHG